MLLQAVCHSWCTMFMSWVSCLRSHSVPRVIADS